MKHIQVHTHIHPVSSEHISVSEICSRMQRYADIFIENIRHGTGLYSPTDHYKSNVLVVLFHSEQKEQFCHKSCYCCWWIMAAWSVTIMISFNWNTPQQFPAHHLLCLKHEMFNIKGPNCQQFSKKHLCFCGGQSSPGADGVWTELC